MGDEEIKKLGGLPAHEIAAKDTALENRIQVIERYIWPPGQPDMLTAARAYTDVTVNHKHNNALQAIGFSEAKMSGQLQRIEEKGDMRHSQNTDKLDSVADSIEKGNSKSDKIMWLLLTSSLASAGALAMQLFGHHA